MQTMQERIETIKQAVADGATAEAKQAGSHACQAILAALQAEPGRPLVSPAGAAPPSPPGAGAVPPLPPGPDPSQVLDLVIAKLRTMVDATDETDEPTLPGSVAPFRVPLVGLSHGLPGSEGR